MVGSVCKRMFTYVHIRHEALLDPPTMIVDAFDVFQLFIVRARHGCAIENQLFFRNLCDCIALLIRRRVTHSGIGARQSSLVFCSTPRSIQRHTKPLHAGRERVRVSPTALIPMMLNYTQRSNFGEKEFLSSYSFPLEEIRLSTASIGRHSLSM